MNACTICFILTQSVVIVKVSSQRVLRCMKVSTVRIEELIME